MRSTAPSSSEEGDLGDLIDGPLAEDFDAVPGDVQHLLDAHALRARGSGVGLESEGNPLLDDHGMLKGDGPPDDGRFVEGEADAVAPVASGRLVLVPDQDVAPDLGTRRPLLG